MSGTSVVIPVYNQEEELQKTLASIHAQTIAPAKIIVVDDGSTSPVSKAKGCVHIRQENKGAAAARNRGFKKVDTTFVIFWDADVVAEPNMLEKMRGALLNTPQASVAFSNHMFGTKKMRAAEFSLEVLKEKNYIHTTSLVRAKDFAGFDESLKRFQDWDLWLTMAEEKKRGVWLDEYLFTVSPGGTMSAWLPSFAYKKPWKWIPGFRGRVQAYETAQAVLKKKHQLA